MDVIYKAEHDGQILMLFFRDDVLSNRVSFQDLGAKEFIAHLEEWRGETREHLCGYRYGCRNLWSPYTRIGKGHSWPRFMRS
jgi:hypothetical protein